MNIAPGADSATGGNWYEVFGLSISSELPLPELFASHAREAPDVSIRFADLPPLEGEYYDDFAVTPDGAILNVPGAARYLVKNGREIIVHPDPEGSERHLRLYLLGSALGAILHQRHLLPLHANSIEIGGAAVAFMGHSGAGKSTMAAWFHDRGFNVLADDVCVVTFDGTAAPVAHPGIPRLRMWRDALEASGRSIEGHELSFDDAEKYNVPTRSGASEPLPLRGIYLLRKAETEEQGPLIRPLQGIEAIDALVANTYRGAYIPMLGGIKRHLASCLALARSIPIFSVDRLWGKDHLDRQLREIEAHARSLVES